MKEANYVRLTLATDTIDLGQGWIEVVYGGLRLPIDDLDAVGDMLKFSLRSGGVLLLDPDAEFGIIRIAAPEGADSRETPPPSH
ncbi:hypothetical protein [Allosphingosinicella deserti]|uniref:Uncharacterized protein n=1 Tax=Allosphingosinicella deserti TaxID=2116704 RepID=A0A2P7QW89_9SPHN|nr:hypothetical protein [Sphingomonas deserti]PSJ42232.1 hypothetical protein C7I55_08350 [Sphingomonas deserti]